MSCTVVASDAARGYTITTTYVADPGSDSVLMRVHFSGPAADQLYVRLDPLAGGTGGGGTQNAGGNSATLASGPNGAIPVAFNTNTTTNAVNRTYAVPTFEALESADGFSQASVGYVGSASDGLTMLDSSHQLTTYDSAPNGHVALTAGVRLPRNGTTTLALGFGTTQSAALATAATSVRRLFGAGPEPLRVRLGALRRRSAAPLVAAGPIGDQRVLRIGQRRSRPPRTRRSPGRSPPGWPRPGASRSRPAT